MSKYCWASKSTWNWTFLNIVKKTCKLQLLQKVYKCHSCWRWGCIYSAIKYLRLLYIYLICPPFLFSLSILFCFWKRAVGGGGSRKQGNPSWIFPWWTVLEENNYIVRSLTFAIYISIRALTCYGSIVPLSYTLYICRCIVYDVWLNMPSFIDINHQSWRRGLFFIKLPRNMVACAWETVMPRRTPRNGYSWLACLFCDGIW